MRKRVVAKGNIHKTDHLRALVTDTMPGDIPIIISNDGFYKNMRASPHSDVSRQEFISSLLKSPKAYTMPYRYHITKAGGSSRKLSLIHPAGQLAIASFYEDSGHLICYHARKSKASIRSPRKIGSLFFIRGSLSEKNKYKKAGIDTVDIETSVSNPASYFTYAGELKAYKFFKSTDYTRLEKRYGVMCLADVSKCFSSIYTHTLFWATADVQTAKDNVMQDTFSNRFDRLMQSVNFNETNGICIGPEVSRVFAELILSEVDKRIIATLASEGLTWKVDYEFRRYVDDFYIFSLTDDIRQRVLAVMRLALSEFNLHLNDEKTTVIARPFITKRTRIVNEADKALTLFFDRFIHTHSEAEGAYNYPSRIWNSDSVLRIFLDDIKASCFDNNCGYEAVGNYVIGALALRIASLIADYDRAIKREDATDSDYVSAIGLLLEAIYFFYNVDPTVSSSLRVAQAAIQSFNLFREKIPDRTPFLSEQIVRWTYQFVKAFKVAARHKSDGLVPLEAINILLVLGEVGRGQALVHKTITDFCNPVEKLEYFEIVSYLFCIKDDAAFADLREQLFLRAKAMLLDGRDLRIDAQSAFLALDVLSCPYILKEKRAKLFNRLRTVLQLKPVPVAASIAAIETFEREPWFVQWGDANLLHMIRKKELSEVY